MSLKIDPTREVIDQANYSTSGASVSPTLLFQKNAATDPNLANQEQQQILRQQEMQAEQAKLLANQNQLLAEQANMSVNQPTQAWSGIVGNPKYKLTTKYGGKSALSGRPHWAIDIATPMRTSVYSPGTGVVTGTGAYNGEMKIKFDNGWSMFIAHLDKMNYKKGDRVNFGDAIAVTGARGYSTGPHLHLQIFDANGKAVDPTNFYYGKDNPFASGKGEDISLDKNKNFSISTDGQTLQLPQQPQTFDLGKYLDNLQTQYLFGQRDPFLQSGSSANYLFSPMKAGNIDTVIQNPAAVSSSSAYPNPSSVYSSPSPQTTASSAQTSTDTNQLFPQTTSTQEYGVKETVDTMLQGQIDALQPGYEDIYNQVYGNIGVKRPGNFGADPVDQILLDLKIVDEATGKSLDMTTLNYLRSQVAARNRSNEILSKSAAQSAASQINTAQQARRSFIGRNPGDVSQSFAGRNATSSFNREAVDKIAAQNLLYDQQRNTVENQLTSNALSRIDLAEQRQLQMDLQKAGLLFNAKVQDKSIKSQKDALIAAKEYNSIAQQINLNATLNSSKNSMLQFYATYIPTLTQQIAVETDEAKKKELQDEFVTAQKKYKEIMESMANQKLFVQ